MSNPSGCFNALGGENLRLNRLEVHSTCLVPYSLRPKKGSEAPPSCRFFFPRPLFPDAVVTQEVNHKRWLFSPARN